MRKDKAATEKINRQIRANEVRCVGEHVPPNETNGVMTLSQVIDFADDLDLDVVEISPNAKPVVVKVMDYAKFLYEKKRKSKEQKSTKTITKEIKIMAYIGSADLERKTNDARKFLEKGFKVKVSSMARGRKFENMKDDVTSLALSMFLKLEDVSTVEVIPSFKGSRMVGILKPKKLKNG